MTRLTLAGAIFLTVIAIMPDVLLFELNVPTRIAYFFGGTGMLITVGVILDTMRQVETFLLQRHYDGFLRKGRIRARSANPQQGATGEALSQEAVMNTETSSSLSATGSSTLPRPEVQPKRFAR